MTGQAEDDAQLRERLQLLRKRFVDGKIKIAPDLSVVESLKAVRYGADGEVDLSTVDAKVRSLTLTFSVIQEREETKSYVSLSDITQTYFEYLHRNFDWLYKQMKEAETTPAQVAAHFASDPKRVEQAAKLLVDFGNIIEEFWEAAVHPAYYHVQDLRGLKAVFGGETFPVDGVLSDQQRGRRAAPTIDYLTTAELDPLMKLVARSGRRELQTGLRSGKLVD